ncbi:hypothetical protein [Acinetobacter larvae]|uniref:DUF4175 domain-containing protein n=1 Tax=Acinetobacter larvae TaxID=1789224 RepID=A0A1B2M3G7_9GAMM|nr:hypothetical protein [Acinetobacter larvae]AOA59681.1 hypothetical protein BFG52_15875 [Acinetobacter larvae]
MNAPRQGLFASLLIISFALHTFLMVVATTHQLKENRTNQGQLMTSQLVTDSMLELESANTISLALIAKRYATNPSVAAIRILDARQQVLATSGLAKTREGEVFVRDALLNEKKIGRVEVTLIKPSTGEILRSQWWAIVVSLLIHALLWLAYRAIARPTRSEYLARMNQEARLKHEIIQLTEALEAEKNQQALAIAQAQQQQQENKALERKLSDQAVAGEDIVAINIQYYDPKQLLKTVNQSVSIPYFNLCQIFLEKSIEQCTQYYQLDPKLIMVQQKFNQQGAMLSATITHPQAVACLLLIGSVFQLLSDVLYKRYREERRFVLQTRCGVAMAVEVMQLNAPQAAARLTQQLIAKEMALYLSNEQLKTICEQYQLVAMPNPSSVLTRHAFMVNGLNSDLANLVQEMRTEILRGKNHSSLQQHAPDQVGK